MTEFFQTAIPALLAILLHELAHGYAARHFGDLSAFFAGRLSLNPLKHADPIGTVAVPALSYFVGGFVFGWARPVPVCFEMLSRRERFLVCAAGPACNLAQAALWALLLASPLAAMALEGIRWNLFLGLFNLAPLLPLDGGRMLQQLLPDYWALRFERTEPYGMFVIVGLLVLLSFLIGGP